MKNKNWWIAFSLLSLLLLTGYTVGLGSESLEPFLKSLNTLQHFGIHYAVGVFTAMMILSAWLYKTKRRANEPLTLMIAVLVSHFPDFRFAFHRQEHESWEIIFLGHTAVDNVFFPLFYIIFIINVVIIFWYRQQIKVVISQNK